MLYHSFEPCPQHSNVHFRAWLDGPRYPTLLSRCLLLARLLLTGAVLWASLLVLTLGGFSQAWGPASLLLAGLCCISFALKWYVTLQAVVEERLLLLPSLGLQATSITRGNSEHRRFFPADSINSLLINETISSFSVSSVLVLSLRSRPFLSLCFPSLRPPLVFLALVRSEFARIFGDSN